MVLAVATFASVRSANRAGRSAERALQVGLRPVLFASRPHETVQKIRWGDGHWAALPPAAPCWRRRRRHLHGDVAAERGLGHRRPARVEGWTPSNAQSDTPRSRRCAPERPDVHPEVAHSASRPVICTPRRATSASGRPRSARGTTRTGARSWRCRDGSGPAGRPALRRPRGRPADDQPLPRRPYPGKDEEWFHAVVQHWSLDREPPR